MAWRGAAIFVLALMLCVGCDSPAVVEMASVDCDEWSESCSLVVDNDDTLSLRRISIAVRYNRNFEGKTLPLHIAVAAPDACHTEELVTLAFEPPYSATSVATSINIPYRHSACLSQRGRYIFTITPQQPLSGFEAVGVSIESE